MHIGLFDSGVGGLTVLRAIREALPDARFSYLGDTARLPYGNKAPETLRQYTRENIEFLDRLGVDVIVIACHSASSVSLSLNQSAKGTPILNVITPSGLEALKLSRTKKIGLLATKATVRSQVYPTYLKELDTEVEVISQAAPLLVPLVEEDALDDEVTKILLKRYLAPFKEAQVDTLVLGCTHYPLLRSQIQKICGAHVQLIDPAHSVANSLAPLLKDSSHTPANCTLYLSDLSPHFLDQARHILGTDEELELASVQQILPSGKAGDIPR